MKKPPGLFVLMSFLPSRKVLHKFLQLKEEEAQERFTAELK